VADRSEENDRETKSIERLAMIVNVGIQAPTKANAVSKMDQIVESAVSSCTHVSFLVKTGH
jgi:hypothetical protein